MGNSTIHLGLRKGTWDLIATLEMRASCLNITDRLKTDDIGNITVFYLQGRNSNVATGIQRDTLWGTLVVMEKRLPFVYTVSIIDSVRLSLWMIYQRAIYGEISLPRLQNGRQ